MFQGIAGSGVIFFPFLKFAAANPKK